jgi:hypothetical protein
MKLFLSTLFTFSILSLSAPAAAQAATNWGALSGTDLYLKSADAAAETDPVKYSTLSGAIYFKNAYAEEMDGYYQVLADGAATNVGEEYTYLDGHASVSYEYSDKKESYLYPIETITIKDKIYLMFPDAQLESMQGKWIPLTGAQYDTLGEALGLEDLFDSGVSKHKSDHEEFNKKFEKQLKKYSLYKISDEPIEDDYEVEDATRYDLVLNRDTIVEFYQAFDKSLTKEEREMSLLSWKGFSAALKKDAFVDQMVADSYRSVWIDEESQQPVRIVDIFAVPVIGKKDKYTYIVNDLSFEKKASEPETVPTDIMSFGQAVKALKLKIKAPEEVEIAKLLKAVKKQKVTSEKAATYEDIAELYVGLIETKKAAEYYRKAASFVTKGSAEYYRLLKLAEQALGNSKKEKEFSELEKNAPK